MKIRIEKDSFGEVEVPHDAYWGASTQRSYNNFKISKQTFPLEFIYSYALLKKCAAQTNCELSLLDKKFADAIVQACDEILLGRFDTQFPLDIYQTGSGTQTNMNLNEVIANRATEILGVDFKVQKKIHPNDHVNLGQSSNDTFPTVMHITALCKIEQKLIPTLEKFCAILKRKIESFEGIIKIGRTHLQDATPLTLAQEFSGYLHMIHESLDMLRSSSKKLQSLAIGATAVGTGINTHHEFSSRVCQKLSDEIGLDFRSSANKFHALTSHDGLVFAHGALEALAANLHKIANDIRWLGSGPRCAIGELKLPSNEAGSSIMPGKVNPTQAEALTMVCAKVLGNGVSINFASSNGNFELNVYKPVIIASFLESLELLVNSIKSFATHCVDGLEANVETITHHLHQSLMLVTALNPSIGYEKAAKVAKNAYEKNISLKQSIVELGWMSEEDFDTIVDPRKMVTQEIK